MRTKHPGTFLDLDLLTKLSAHDRLLTFVPNAELLLRDSYIEVLSPSPWLHGDNDVHLAQLLCPSIW